jgi:hypothetical protein
VWCHCNSLQFTANRCLLVLPTDTGEEGATVAAGLRREHDVAMKSLLYGSSPPTFDDVIERATLVLSCSIPVAEGLCGWSPSCQSIM